MIDNSRVIYSICLASLIVSSAFGDSLNSGRSSVLTAANAVIPNGIGVNIHFRDNPRGMKAVQSVGAKWVRMDFTWHKVEKEKGVYDFSELDALVRDCDAAGIKILAILDYSNPIYEKRRSITTDEGREAFKKYAVAAVSRYKGKEIVWEIWNEPNNAGFWVGNSPVEYMELVKVVSPALRKVDPEIILLGPSTYKVALKYTEECLKMGLLDYVDWISFHPYRRDRPEDLVDDMKSLRQLIGRYLEEGEPMPTIISSEWGFPSLRYTERGQAIRVPRAIFLSMMEKLGIYIYYDIWNDGRSLSNNEHHYGLLTSYPLLLPKPAGISYMTALRVMDGFSFNRRLQLPDCNTTNHFLLEFINGAEELRYVHWYSPDVNSRKQEWRIPAEMGDVTRVTMMGQALEGVFKPNEIMTSTEEVQYLVPAATVEPRYKIVGRYVDPDYETEVSWAEYVKSTPAPEVADRVFDPGSRDVHGVIDFWVKPSKSDYGKTLVIGGDLKKPFYTLKIGLREDGNVYARHWVWPAKKWLEDIAGNQPLIVGRWTRITYVFGKDGRRLYIDGLSAAAEPSETRCIPYGPKIKKISDSIGMMQVVSGLGYEL